MGIEVETRAQRNLDKIQAIDIAMAMAMTMDKAKIVISLRSLLYYVWL
jgi:hypothetical protein